MNAPLEIELTISAADAAKEIDKLIASIEKKVQSLGNNSAAKKVSLIDFGDSANSIAEMQKLFTALNKEAGSYLATIKKIKGVRFDAASAKKKVDRASKPKEEAPKETMSPAERAALQAAKKREQAEGTIIRLINRRRAVEGSANEEALADIDDLIQRVTILKGRLNNVGTSTNPAATLRKVSTDLDTDAKKAGNALSLAERTKREKQFEEKRVAFVAAAEARIARLRASYIGGDKAIREAGIKDEIEDLKRVTSVYEFEMKKRAIARKTSAVQESLRSAQADRFSPFRSGSVGRTFQFTQAIEDGVVGAQLNGLQGAVRGAANNIAFLAATSGAANAKFLLFAGSAAVVGIALFEVGKKAGFFVDAAKQAEKAVESLQRTFARADAIRSGGKKGLGLFQNTTDVSDAKRQLSALRTELKGASEDVNDTAKRLAVLEGIKTKFEEANREGLKGFLGGSFFGGAAQERSAQAIKDADKLIEKLKELGASGDQIAALRDAPEGFLYGIDTKAVDDLVQELQGKLSSQNLDFLKLQAEIQVRVENLKVLEDLAPKLEKLNSVDIRFKLFNLDSLEDAINLPEIAKKRFEELREPLDTRKKDLESELLSLQKLKIDQTTRGDSKGLRETNAEIQRVVAALTKLATDGPAALDQMAQAAVKFTKPFAKARRELEALARRAKFNAEQKLEQRFASQTMNLEEQLRVSRKLLQTSQSRLDNAQRQTEELEKQKEALRNRSEESSLSNKNSIIDAEANADIKRIQGVGSFRDKQLQNYGKRFNAQIDQRIGVLKFAAKSGGEQQKIIQNLIKKLPVTGAAGARQIQFLNNVRRRFAGQQVGAEKEVLRLQALKKQQGLTLDQLRQRQQAQIQGRIEQRRKKAEKDQLKNLDNRQRLLKTRAQSAEQAFQQALQPGATQDLDSAERQQQRALDIIQQRRQTLQSQFNTASDAGEKTRIDKQIQQTFKDEERVLQASTKLQQQRAIADAQIVAQQKQKQAELQFQLDEINAKKRDSLKFETLIADKLTTQNTLLQTQAKIRAQIAAFSAQFGGGPIAGSSSSSGILGALAGGLSILGGLGGIPTFATGGLATGGKPAIVGEQGPELIVPTGNVQVIDAVATASLMNARDRVVPGGSSRISNTSQTFTGDIQVNTLPDLAPSSGKYRSRAIKARKGF